MDYTHLGNTGLKVSVAGLGCGGFSRLGMTRGGSRAEAAAIVTRAIDHGVNLIDTAPAYGTEQAVGDAIKGHDRTQLVVSTKALIFRQGELVRPDDIIASLNDSLARLATDYVDVFLLHAVRPEHSAHALDVIYPVIEKEKSAGKIRHIGVTETPPNDPGHNMLADALGDSRIEVAMVGFHMMYQTARQKVFPLTQANGVGTLGMFAVRNIFSQPERLQAAVAELQAAGDWPSELDADHPLQFLIHDAGAESLIDAAYRYCRHEPGLDVVLFGTGVAAHLDTAIESILRPPLPAADQQRLRDLFGGLRGVGLDLPSGR